MGRGGRIVLDRISTSMDDFWRTLDFTIYEPERITKSTECRASDVKDEHSTDSNINSFTNLDISSHLNNYSNTLKTSFKTELSSRDSNLRTSVSESVFSANSEIKQEPEEITEEWSIPSEINTCSQDQEPEMIEFLEEIRRDWYVHKLLKFCKSLFVLSSICLMKLVLKREKLNCYLF